MRRVSRLKSRFKDKFQYAQTDTVTSLFEAALTTNAIDSILMVLDHFGIKKLKADRDSWVSG
jgi:hypothetical protein